MWGYWYNYTITPYGDSFISGIWDFSHMTNFRYGHGLCRGLNTVWQIFYKCTSYDLFTSAHVFACLSMNVKGLWYSVWMMTRPLSSPFWLIILSRLILFMRSHWSMSFQFLSFLSHLTEWYFFICRCYIFLVIYFSVQLTVSSLIHFSAKGNIYFPLLLNKDKRW